MRARVAEVAAVAVMAAVVTVLLAAPVLLAPSERVFGMEIVGRHHDPFTAMEQFAGPLTVGVYTQPVTDIMGALLARVSGPVAAYNWLVLLSFPLSAAAAYLLARYLKLSQAGATVAALAYAFSPFHLAHAAYHPHITQIQWLPLYLLALWRCLDNASPLAIAFLGGATLAVTLSNFYGGLIAAVITPVAVAAYWFTVPRAAPGARRRLVVTLVSLVLLVAAGIAYAWYAARMVFAHWAAFAFPLEALFDHSAHWWSYLVPPVAHPMFGARVQRFWATVGVHEGLVEQQVSLGWGIVGLGLVAVSRWLIRDRQLRLSLTRVPVLVFVAVVALLCSLSPEGALGSLTLVRPAALVHDVVPMFRAYARFGIVVLLMAVLLAGTGVEYLWHAGTRRARIACVALVVLAAAEYAVTPSAMWRDVLPTKAHRWVVNQEREIRALDCTPRDQESASVQWLTRDRVKLLERATDDCLDINVAQILAAKGYTHLLVRRDAVDLQSFAAEHPMPDGLRVAARFHDGAVFAISSEPLPIYTANMTGVSPRAHNAEWAWRSIGSDAVWTVVNTRARPIAAILTIEMSAADAARALTLRVDGRTEQTLTVAPLRRTYQIGPMSLNPGRTDLTFHTVRDASIMFGTWNWTEQGERP